MSAQHTPGPWQVNHTDRTQVCDSSDVLGCAPIAWVARRNARGRAEDYANARLIAVAPELLGALNLAVTLLRTHVNPEDLGGERFDLTDCKDMAPIFAAIAKATGSAG